MQLSELANQLKLGNLSHAESLAQIAANTEQSYINFLIDVLKSELAARTQRSRDVLLRTAGLPVVKTLEQYDFGYFDSNLHRMQPGIQTANLSVGARCCTK